jgi:hypothetical protein
VALKTAPGKSSELETACPPSTNRERPQATLVFIVSQGDDTDVDFVLNKDQCAELAVYLQQAGAALLEPLGRKPDQISLVAMRKQRKRGGPTP